mgnify:FL=1
MTACKWYPKIICPNPINQPTRQDRKSEKVSKKMMKISKNYRKTSCTSYKAMAENILGARSRAGFNGPPQL